jgi:two-component system, chemotaxis family, chemotaxis protein CheY
MRARKVLVVEDSKVVHMMYDVMLQQMSVVHAVDGVEALEKLKSHKDVDVILLDISMPRMNGLELLSHLKSNPETVRIPVVIVTTHGKDDETRLGMNAGAAAYVTKPFRGEAILDIIDRLSPGEA